jgi:hypothetical protein
MPLMQEPAITINGKPLTNAQAMTVRVALGSFHISLTGDGLGDDMTGQQLCQGYLYQLQTIFQMWRTPG